MVVVIGSSTCHSDHSSVNQTNGPSGLSRMRAHRSERRGYNEEKGDSEQRGQEDGGRMG